MMMTEHYSPPAQQLSTRDAGRIAREQMALQRIEAESRARIAEAKAAEETRQQNRWAREAARDRRRAAWTRRYETISKWVADHVVDLLFVPIIGIPGTLAWTGMADYGYAEYGPPGLSLPGLSEGGMWAFAAATTITRNRDETAPLWHLRIGTLVFAAYGATLNFLHGLAEGGPIEGATMALVSVAGVTAHQLITAGPRRSRATADYARLLRQIARRERAASKAAVRQALVDVDDKGNATLIFTPGRVTLSKRRLVDPPTLPTPTAHDEQGGQTAQHDDQVEQDPSQTAQDPAGQDEQPPPAAPEADGEQDNDEGKPGNGEPEQSDQDDDGQAHNGDPSQDEQDSDQSVPPEWMPALTGMRATTRAGNPYSQRQLVKKFGISRPAATKIAEWVEREMAGQATVF